MTGMPQRTGRIGPQRVTAQSEGGGDRRCPSTFVYNLQHYPGSRSVQCRHTRGHTGRHAMSGEQLADVLWTDDEADGAVSS